VSHTGLLRSGLRSQKEEDINTGPGSLVISGRGKNPRRGHFTYPNLQKQSEKSPRRLSKKRREGENRAPGGGSLLGWREADSGYP